MAAAANVEKLSKLELLKLLEKFKKERDDAIHRESFLKEKLRQQECRTQVADVLKRKLKNMSLDNRVLRKTVKSLRVDLGLESSPKFQGKTTSDIIHELHEKERQCSFLRERNGKLSLAVDSLTSQLSNNVASKAIVEEELQALQQSLKDMTNNQRRLLKLWEDKKVQREQLMLPAIPQRTGHRAQCQRAVQTDISIGAAHKLPPGCFEGRQYRWEAEKNKCALERGSSSGVQRDGREKASLLP